MVVSSLFSVGYDGHVEGWGRLDRRAYGRASATGCGKEMETQRHISWTHEMLVFPRAVRDVATFRASTPGGCTAVSARIISGI